MEGWLFATGLLRLRPGNLVRAPYLKYYLALPATRDWIDRHTTGTAVPTISTRAFGALPVVLPPLTAQVAMAEALGMLDEQVEVHERISVTAARLRDTLAPLLLTGSGRDGPHHECATPSGGASVIQSARARTTAVIFDLDGTLPVTS